MQNMRCRSRQQKIHKSRIMVEHWAANLCNETDAGTLLHDIRFSRDDFELMDAISLLLVYMQSFQLQISFVEPCQLACRISPAMLSHGVVEYCSRSILIVLLLPLRIGFIWIDCRIHLLPACIRHDHPRVFLGRWPFNYLARTVHCRILDFRSAISLSCLLCRRSPIPSLRLH